MKPELDPQAKVYMENADKFYRGQVFGMFGERFDRLEEQIEGLRKDASAAHANLERRIDDLEKKIVWIYAFAMGVAFAGAFLVDWIKQKLFP